MIPLGDGNFSPRSRLRPRWHPALAVLCVLPPLACGTGCVSTAPVGPAAERDPFGKNACVFYVTGIGGVGSDARRLGTGLSAAGFEGRFRICDWTGGEWPLAALRNGRRHRTQARRLAAAIERQRRQHPGDRIILIAHSGGAGVAVGALESLPPRVEVDSALLLSPALSRRYDLSDALRRISGRLTTFTSRRDGLVLGVGTSLVGTVDGPHGEAAGLSGFRRPPGGDVRAYAKLVHRPYKPSWLAYGNDGGHFGALSKSFAAHVLAPLLRVSDDRVAPFKAE